MESAANNPADNALGPGVSDALVEDAVQRSGYPLQAIVGDRLWANFEFVQDEWTFIDRDSGELRALDLHAVRRLWPNDDQPRVRPELNLLVECKHADLPYIFFLGSGSSFPRFPLLVGPRATEVTLTTDDDRSTYTLSTLHALGLEELDFVTKPPRCMTFSRAVRKGGDLDLSGSDAYNSLVLPLLKATLFFERTRSGRSAWYSDLHFVVPVGVLDAPMITVRVAGAAPQLELTPWVRLVRHESYDSVSWTDRERVLAIDLVHSGFLDEYLSNHLLPFADEAGKRVMGRQDVLISEKGFAKGLGQWSRGQPLYETLQPRPPVDGLRRLRRPRR